ncbi:DUF5133 domain-containing protein [Streptomyces sp. NPDC007896]|uniref:DUF5133 domain-containing protein n=1 Tax=Streptomyces sp. NPDC007896 TaxID=3364784 RepID=UPI0036EE4044
MLLPAKAEVARHLERYRAWERLLLMAPADHTVRGNFENTGYTLCVLMGKRCAREAVDAAEHYLRGEAPASARSSMTVTHGARGSQLAQRPQGRGVGRAVGGRP